LYFPGGKLGKLRLALLGFAPDPSVKVPAGGVTTVLIAGDWAITT
jgi:hypothetical protein